MTTYYKVLGEGGAAFYGGTGKWFLPVGKRPGKWMPKIVDPVACRRGYHIVTIDQLPDWLGPFIFEAEVRGQVIVGADKSVAEQARLLRPLHSWNESSARLFAADCAEHTLHVWEAHHPNDRRPRDAVEAARAFARGEISSAAESAARSAAWSAAESAASAAESAAKSAARSAAWSAAWSAERGWQAERLLQYLTGDLP